MRSFFQIIIFVLLFICCKEQASDINPESIEGSEVDSLQINALERKALNEWLSFDQTES